MAHTPPIPAPYATCPKCNKQREEKHCEKSPGVPNLRCPWWLCRTDGIAFTAAGGSMPIKAPA